MKAHQRIIREKFERTPPLSLFAPPESPCISRAELAEITYGQAKQIIEQYEWLGTMGLTQYHYGIYFDGELGGAVCFGYLQAMQGYATYVGDDYEKRGIQLSRGACAYWCHEHAGSKLIAYGLRKMKEMGFKWCVAFSDPEAGEIGTLYQATNWHYLGFSDSASAHYDVYYKDGRVYMNDRDFHREHGFSGKAKMQEWADARGFVVRRRNPKARYIKLLGDKRENKQMMEHLERHIKPYPKRDSHV